MYGLIGIFILFGLTGKSNVPIEEIWSENSANYASFASITMARERFQLIVKNICFDNILTRDIRKLDKFRKMSEIFNKFKDNLNLITPSSFLCIDETLYSFRWRCFYRQYIPSKPARYGIKYWCLADIITGYTSRFNCFIIALYSYPFLYF